MIKLLSILRSMTIFQILIAFIGALTKSQFPVFTIYAQKSCLGVRPCARAWCVDRVQNYKLNGHAKRSMPVTTRRDCLELCLGETEFTCRSKLTTIRKISTQH
uniref:Apple domain-containing protein n=1 Tax=Glossina austeni TaxID=7395 RepID=A0A1A9UM92_GLOAU